METGYRWSQVPNTPGRCDLRLPRHTGFCRTAWSSARMRLAVVGNLMDQHLERLFGQALLGRAQSCVGKASNTLQTRDAPVHTFRLGGFDAQDMLPGRFS